MSASVLTHLLHSVRPLRTDRRPYQAFFPISRMPLCPELPSASQPVRVEHTRSGGSSSVAYRILNLNPGAYRVSASAPQLTTPQPVSIVLRPGPNTLNLQLKVTTANQQVTVSDNSLPAVSVEQPTTPTPPSSQVRIWTLFRTTPKT